MSSPIWWQRGAGRGCQTSADRDEAPQAGEDGDWLVTAGRPSTCDSSCWLQSSHRRRDECHQRLGRGEASLQGEGQPHRAEEWPKGRAHDVRKRKKRGDDEDRGSKPGLRLGAWFLQHVDRGAMEPLYVFGNHLAP